MIDPIQRLRDQWLVLALSKHLRKQPIGLTILETPVVLFRTQNHQLGLLLDRCPHRNAPLSQGKVLENSIQCPYHGWQFERSGNCNVRPGADPTAHLDCGIPHFEVLEEKGLIWCRLATNKVEAKNASKPMLTSWWNDANFAHFTWCDDIDAGIIDGLENLLDATHTPFVHAGLIRSEKHSQDFQATIRIKSNCVEAEYSQEGKQSGWISQIFERDRQSSFGRFIPPCTAELEYTSSQGTEFVLNAHFTPETKTKTKLFSTFFVRRSKVPMFLKQLLLTPFFKRVLKQDQAILLAQQQNIKRFGEADYSYWEGDLLRGFIESWFRSGKLPSHSKEHHVSLRI